MSPVYTPEKSPPKLERFCYLSHPAQHVMAALYQDYLQRKKDLLECQASKASAHVNYYQSIYKSRFGSVPTELNVKDVSQSSSNQSGTTKSLTHRFDRFNSEDESTTRHNLNKEQNIYHSTDESASRWMSSDTSTYSDSPPIETQGYRILSQFQPEDFNKTADTVCSEKDNIVNTCSTECITRKSDDNALSTNDGSCSYVDTDCSFGSCREGHIFESANRKTSFFSDQILNLNSEIPNLDTGINEINLSNEICLDKVSSCDRSGEIANSFDGSQSLFSQDLDMNNTKNGLFVKQQQRQGLGKNTKKCVRMQQRYENRTGQIGCRNQETTVQTSTGESNSREICQQDVSGREDKNKDSYKKSETDLASVSNDMTVSDKGDKGDSIRTVTVNGSERLDCYGDNDVNSYSKYFLNKNKTVYHKEDINSESRQKQSLEGKTKASAQETFTMQGNDRFENILEGNASLDADIELPVEMESPFVEKTPNLYPVFKRTNKTNSYSTSVRLLEQSVKVPEKKRKTSNCFAVPFKKTKMSTSSRLSTMKAGNLIDTEGMTVKDLQALLSQILKFEEVIIVLVYKDGSTQLRDKLFGQDSKRKHNKVKQDDVEVEYLALSSCYTQDRNVFTFPLKTRDQSQDLVKEFWCQLLRRPFRTVGFHVKETLSAVIKAYKLNPEKVDTSWTVLDPTVGLWLLDPDKPVQDFEAVLHSLNLPEQVPSDDCIYVLYEDMMLLGVSMEKICQKLKNRDMWDLYVCVETKLTTVLTGMEMRVLHVATHTLIKFSDILKKKMKKLEQKAHQSAGHAFLLNSHAQLRQVLFEELCLDKKLPQTTKLAKTNVGREKSTSETVLTQLSPLHELPNIILEYRQLQKLKSTYIDGILSSIRDGTLSTHWDQTAAATGRLTSYHPNIQAIPKLPVSISGYQDNFIAGKDVSDEIQIYARDAFVSQHGYSFVAADFQQIELRLLAHLADDPVLLKTFTDTDNPDIFNVLTAQWFIIPVTLDLEEAWHSHKRKSIFGSITE